MLLKKLLSALLMLTAPLTCFGQTLKVINGDTLITITVDQGRAINGAYVQLDECNEEQGRQKRIIDTCAQIIHLQQEELDSKDQQLRLKNDINEQFRGVNKNLDKEITSLNKKNSLTAFERDILFVGAAIVSLKLFVFK